MNNIPIQERLKAYRYVLEQFTRPNYYSSWLLCDHLRHYFAFVATKPFNHSLSYKKCPELFHDLFRKKTKESRYVSDGWFHTNAECIQALCETILEIEEELYLNKTDI